jgi:hypothetical protein
VARTSVSCCSVCRQPSVLWTGVGYVAAAIVFASVGLLKFHFLWLAPLVLIRNRRRLLAFCVAVAALVSVGFLIDPSWPVRYYESVLTGRAVISKVPYSLFRWL